MRRIAPPCAAMLVLLAAGCAATTDLGPGEAARTDYMVGATYELLHERYLEYQGWPPGMAPPEVVATSIAYQDGGPASVATYRANPQQWPRIVGVLPAGSRLRLKEIVRHRYPMLEDWYQATGVVLDGEFEGREVELMRISLGVADSRMLRVNPAELRLVQAAPDR